MRESDKEFFEKSHDKQIGLTLHDEILVWLNSEGKKDRGVWEKVVKPPEGSDLVSIKSKIECPLHIKAYQGNVIKGFADFALVATVLRDYDKRRYEEEVKWAIQENRPPEKRYQDVLVGYVEIKTQVNLGETIRQINYYRATHEGQRAHWSVCAPPFENSHILVEQGISFIEYYGF